jgi:hypothetical protein
MNMQDQNLLKTIQEEEEAKTALWEKELNEYAAKLSILASMGENADASIEAEAVDIALVAWKLGGIECMKKLHSMAMHIHKKRFKKPIDIDYISIWWDGIGDWRSPWYER